MWCHQPDRDHQDFQDPLAYVVTDLETDVILPCISHEGGENNYGEAEFECCTGPDRFPIWELVVDVSSALEDMTERDVHLWPEDALTAAATPMLSPLPRGTALLAEALAFLQSVSLWGAILQNLRQPWPCPAGQRGR